MDITLQKNYLLFIYVHSRTGLTDSVLSDNRFFFLNRQWFLQTKSKRKLKSSFYSNLIWFVKKTFFEKSKPGLDSAYIILKFRFRKSYDISSIPIVIVKFKCTRKIY